jgi:hypothetical protein
MRKVLNRLGEASRKYDSGELLSGSIKAPAWSKYLSAKGGELTAGDGLSELNALASNLKGDAVKSQVKELGESLRALTKEVRGNWFVSNKNDIDRIDKIAEKITKMGEGVEKASAVSKGASHFEPMSASDKKKLVPLIEQTLADKSLQDEIDKFFSANGSFNLWTLWNTQLRLKGIAAGAVAGTVTGGAVTLAIKTAGSLFLAEDLKKVTAAQKQVLSIFKTLTDAFKNRIKVCSALVSYMEASVR